MENKITTAAGPGISVSDLQADKLYFLASVPQDPLEPHYFLTESEAGEKAWTVNPRNALRFRPTARFKEAIATSGGCVAIEVPADADQRWPVTA